ncbi:unnamed protein product, partial [marine sediment metagenome]
MRIDIANVKHDIESRKENLSYPTREDIDLYRYIFFQHT